MRWIRAPKPREGDTRQHTRFAWWPIAVAEPANTIVWLERYNTSEVWTETRGVMRHWRVLQRYAMKHFITRSHRDEMGR